MDHRHAPPHLVVDDAGSDFFSTLLGDYPTLEEEATMELFQVDWTAIFAPHTSVLELVVRGSTSYLAVVILMRLMLRRSTGELAMMDLVFVLLIAEALANAVAVEDPCPVDSLVYVMTIVGWNYLLNSLSYSVTLVKRLVLSRFIVPAGLQRAP